MTQANPQLSALIIDARHLCGGEKIQRRKKLGEKKWLKLTSDRRMRRTDMVYFKNSECRSARARRLFDRRWLQSLLLEGTLDYELEYGDAIYTIGILFPSMPLTLEYLALKKFQLSDIPIMISVCCQQHCRRKWSMDGLSAVNRWNPF